MGGGFPIKKKGSLLLKHNLDRIHNFQRSHWRIEAGPGRITRNGVVIPCIDRERIPFHLANGSNHGTTTPSEFIRVGGRIDGLTGVWLDIDDPKKARKIAALGVKCSRWLTMHGFAFNVNTDLNYFNHIVPCGITDKKVTSLSNELGHEMDMDEVKRILLQELADVFQFELQIQH